MYTALRATSQTLIEYLRNRLETDPVLGVFFNSALGGAMVVSADTPAEMAARPAEGLSVWLYRVVRDPERINAPPERDGIDRLLPVPLPLRLHFLLTPIRDAATDPEFAQEVLGKALQALYEHPVLRGTDLQPGLSPVTIDLTARLEPMTLEEITRVWHSLDASYRLSVSYEVTVVAVDPDQEPEDIAPVEVVDPEYGILVASG
jgi:hypothetical protein